MKKEEKKQPTIIKYVAVISVIIAIISLVFSIYVGLKDLEYKQTIEKIQLSSLETQKASVLFNENSKKIEVSQQSLVDKINSCDKINRYELSKNLRFLSNARSSLINNNYDLVIGYLNSINIDKICNSEISYKTTYIEVSILAFIWAILIIALIWVIIRK